MEKLSEQSVFTSIESYDNGMIGKKNFDLQEETGDLAIETIARFLPHGDAIASLGEHIHELAKTIIKSGDEADRFSLYILRNLVIATQIERIAQQIGLRNRFDCLSYRVTLKSIERVADHAPGIAGNLQGTQREFQRNYFKK